RERLEAEAEKKAQEKRERLATEQEKQQRITLGKPIAQQAADKAKKREQDKLAAAKERIAAKARAEEEQKRKRLAAEKEKKDKEETVDDDDMPELEEYTGEPEEEVNPFYQPGDIEEYLEQLKAK